MADRSTASFPELRATHEGLVGGSFRPPLGLLGALVLLIGVEYGVRAALPADEFFIAEEQPHTSIHQALAADGPAEVAFLGASVSWNGLDVRLLDRRAERIAGRELHLANYSHFGMRAELALDLAHVIARQDPPPRILYFGVTGHSVAPSQELTPTSWAWRLEDWAREAPALGVDAADEIQGALFNELALHLRTFEVRRDPRAHYARATTERGFSPGPMRGQAVLGHITHRDRTAPNLGRGRQEDDDELMAALVDRGVVGEEGGEVAMVRVEFLERMIAVLQESGIEVVLHEFPLPRRHARIIDLQFGESFQREMNRLARETGATYHSLESIGVTMEPTDFKDASHMNGVGAERYTRAILDAFVVADLRRIYGRN